MNSTTSRVVCSATLLLFMSLASVASAAYTAANVKGSYSFLTNHWAEPGYKESAALGVVTFDGIRTVTGSFLTVTSTGIQTVTILSGSTYSVNPDGSGSITAITAGGTNQFAFVLNSVSSGVAKSAQLIENEASTTSCIENAGVANSINFFGAATVANLRGSYSFLLNRWTTGTQYASVGVATFSGAGRVTVSFVQQKAPGSFVSGSGSGTYKVNSDGSGTMGLTTVTIGGVPHSVHLDFVLNSVSGGIARGIQLLDASSIVSDTVTGTAVHQ
jgi:hypothetical protein